jgi:hypothetical protein
VKILWAKGYGALIALHTVETGLGECDACRAEGVTRLQPVALFDTSDGEYRGQGLCHCHLVDLANELLDVPAGS